MDRLPLPRAPDSGHYEAASDRGGQRAAAIYSLIESAKLSGLNPQHYLADVLARIADHPARRIAELLPWNWQPLEASAQSAWSTSKAMSVCRQAHIYEWGENSSAGNH